MKRLSIILGAALLASACGFSPTIPQASELEAAAKAGKTHDAFAGAILAGDVLWQKRAEDAENMRRAVESWEAAVAVDPHDRATLQRLGYGYYYVAFYLFTTDPQGMHDAYMKGAGFAAAAARCNPDIRKGMDAEGLGLEQAMAKYARPGDVPALFWYASCSARAAEHRGFTAIAGMAPKLKAVQEAVYRLGSKYAHGGVHRFFGAYYTKAPAESEKDKKSKAEFDLALVDGPKYLENTVLYAEYYAKFVQDRELYEKLLKGVIESRPEDDPPAIRFENAKARERSKKLLEKIDEDF